MQLLELILIILVIIVGYFLLEFSLTILIIVVAGIIIWFFINQYLAESDTSEHYSTHVTELPHPSMSSINSNIVNHGVEQNHIMEQNNHDDCCRVPGSISEQCFHKRLSETGNIDEARQFCQLPNIYSASC